MQFILDEHVLQPVNTDTNTCMDIKHCKTHTDCETNLPYGSLVTLYIRGQTNEQGFEKRRNMKRNSSGVSTLCVRERVI